MLVFLVSNSFALNDNSPCVAGQQFRIVILGSSTAAGTGPSVSDSAWVNRYRNYVQAINPNNEVINLARGGYTTYHLMPTNWTQPSGRPAPDVARNITEALTLNPDAIIVNMPSNDASNNFGTAEQLFNFDSLFSMANNNGVAMWICTTQPKTNHNNSQKVIQVAVRDSILQRYGQFAIDFWTEIADSNNSIKPIYDADGTHLNDAGHRILVNRVIGEQILGNLYQATATVDVGASQIIGLEAISCGDELSAVQMEVTAYGQPPSGGVLCYLKVENIDANTSFTYADTAYLAATCEQDTVLFNIDLSETGNYKLTAFTSHLLDTIYQNDSLSTTRFFLGVPELTTAGDTGCIGDALALTAQSNGPDRISWRDIFSAVVDTTDSYTTPPLLNSEFYFVEAVRPDVLLNDELSTDLTTSTDWFGVMVDLVAKEDIVFDSLSFKVASSGIQPIGIYTKTGSYKGSEQDSSAWALWVSETFTLSSSDTLVNIGGSPIDLSAGDTLGIYINMLNPNARLWYLNNGNETTEANTGIAILPATGVPNDLSQTYYPRVFRGSMHYRKSTNTNGSCRSPVQRVVALIDTIQLELGTDTTITELESLELSVSLPGQVQWSTGESSSTIVLDTLNGLQLGQNLISAELTSLFGCVSTDSLLVFVEEVMDSLPNRIYELNLSSFRLYPNPCNDLCFLESDEIIEEVRIWSLDGGEVYAETGSLKKLQLDLLQLKCGVYVIKIITAKGIAIRKLVVE